MDSGAGNVDQGIVERDFATDGPQSLDDSERRPPDDNQGGPSRLADRNVQRYITNRVNRLDLEVDRHSTRTNTTHGCKAGKSPDV